VALFEMAAVVETALAGVTLRLPEIVAVIVFQQRLYG
jgi:hypothetical protein